MSNISMQTKSDYLILKASSSTNEASKKTAKESIIVTPGETITADQIYMKGHGTFIDSEKNMIASVSGTVERINKLISVRPLQCRFIGEIGDVVIGRITEVGIKRWRVDLNSRQDGVLLLNSIQLPGGVQRRKSESDELQMRSFFDEGHLLSAEIHGFFQDGSLSLHTRSTKYGKLRNGSLVIVPSGLVKRSQSHFITLPCGIDVLLGVNGYIWVSKHPDEAKTEDPEALYSNENEEIDEVTRSLIARVCNTITLLSNNKSRISEEMIIYAFDAGVEYEVWELLTLEKGMKVYNSARREFQENTTMNGGKDDMMVM